MTASQGRANCLPETTTPQKRGNRFKTPQEGSGTLVANQKTVPYGEKSYEPLGGEMAESEAEKGKGL